MQQNIAVPNYSSNTFYEYHIISDPNGADGANPNIPADLFFKINRFYQNKCMEQQSHTWKCLILYNKLYLKKIFQSKVLEISENAVFYVDYVYPNIVVFQKKNISFLKRIVTREYRPQPEMLPLHPNELSEVNEICFQIDNVVSKETYYIHLRIITNLYNGEKYHQVSYVTNSKEMFYMLLPFYLWGDKEDGVDRNVKHHKG